MTDWRWTFFINIPIGIAAFIIIARFCPSIKRDIRPKIDYWGAAAITVALTSLVLAVDNTKLVFQDVISGGISLTTIRIVLYLVAALATGAFILIERKAEEPIIPMRFFKSRNYIAIITAALMFGAAFIATILYITQFNQQVFGADATMSGLMLLPLVGGLTVTSAIIGQVVSKTGHYKRYILAGFALVAVGIFTLVTLGADSPYWYEAILTLFIGIGLGSGLPILNLAVQNEFSQKDLGAATSSNQLFRGLGSTLGTAVLSGILTVGVASSISDIQKSDYVKALRQSPESVKVLGANGSLDVNSALQINVNQKEITSRAIAGINESPLPSAAKQAQIKKFKSDQAQFRRDVVDSFTESLHVVFVTSAGLMVLAFIAILFMKEKELSGDSTMVAAD